MPVVSTATVINILLLMHSVLSILALVQMKMECNVRMQNDIISPLVYLFHHR